MATSRRNFLKSGTLGLLCVGMPAVLAKVAVGHPAIAGRTFEGNAKSVFEFTKDAFAPHLNTTFRVQTGTVAFNLKLTKITDLKAISRNPARIAGKESFSLLFSASSKTTTPNEGTYVIEHAALGRFSLFLASVGKPTNRHHEAIIVRL